jgi:bisphosphoglycerate-dependent phosphoglycerate mutase family 1
MYGRLTGLSKQMVKQRHGDTQFKAWRRGFRTPPPQVSSFSQHYPGNDARYKRYLTDIRYSVRESVIRSIEAGRPCLHRKFPKSESLKDCMDRTIPFFTERIVPEAIDQGKRVLISSSENAIRGLLMHLCEIPEDEITGLEIPNGLPIIYDIESKCVKLLDDGTGRDPLEVHNFGKAAKYLFRPCLNEDGSPDEECDISFVGDPSVILSQEEVETIAAIKNGWSTEELVPVNGSNSSPSTNATATAVNK